MMAMKPKSVSACLLMAGLLSTTASAQQSARETFDADMTRQGQGETLGQWSQWQYESAPLSAAAGLDLDFAWGYVDAAAASEGDVFIAVVRNHSSHAYCVRPRVSFKGDVSRVHKLDASVWLAPGKSMTVAKLRIARRTKVEHDINAAFWPSPAGQGPERCSGSEPAGLSTWLGLKGEAPFPGNRVRVTRPAG